MKIVQMADAVRYPGMTTAELRKTFLLQDLFQEGRMETRYVDLDRTVIGGVVPTVAPLALETQPELRAEYFLERRELGVLNVGGSGFVAVDGTTFPMDKLDCLYVGRGSQTVVFASDDAAHPATFYLLSYPAHNAFPSQSVKFADLTPVHLGSKNNCNKRSIYKAIFLDGIRSCQLVMGFTLLDEGSNWNTMPPHTHMRRSEVYFYFDLPEDQRAIHLMGPPDETRHLVIRDRDVVVSPGWSIHAGVGTTNYGFCWGMGGENQRYDDMDALSISDLI